MLFVSAILSQSEPRPPRVPFSHLWANWSGANILVGGQQHMAVMQPLSWSSNY
ncbi:hypothetical protein L210DRAFT_3553321 [Boletus edulis BED1]|uniref:Uncharacterized protein n=1 Tax=Boletus edulis BED1 TaxID=1328754 RepID=A0AAD4GC09_BOLED|nr:hypothetical protein L210DRAFT_3553321 [Boletus edulis BED1]